MRTASTVITLTLLLAVSPCAFAAPFNGMVLFGDSNLDVGNLNRFTNGPVWGEYLASDLNLPAPKASNARGTNYAWGGAKSGFGIDAPFGGTIGPVPTVGRQIENYLSRNAPGA